MLDIIQSGNSHDKPTWEDIEFIIESHIKRCCDQCNNAVTHSTCFVGDGSKVTEIIALGCNLHLQNVITNIISELIATDPFDICFKQFIKRLKLRLKHYELVPTP